MGRGTRIPAFRVEGDLAVAFLEAAERARRPDSRKDKGYTTVLEAALRAFLTESGSTISGVSVEERTWIEAFRSLTPARRKIGLQLLAALRPDQGSGPAEDSGPNVRNRSR